MKKELETKKSGELAASDTESWGQSPIVTAQDIVIPKILPLQHMSEKVTQGKGKYGEFRDTLSNNLFGDLAQPVEFVPFHVEKKWLEFEMIPKKGGAPKREYRGTVKIQDNPTQPGYNDELPLREEGLERDRCMDFYVVVPSEVAAGEALPYVISFRRTSLKGGKKLMTQMYVRNRAAGKVPAATVMKLVGTDTSNDDGSYIVQDVELGRAATNEEVIAAKYWYDIIKKGGARVDESEFKEEADKPVKTVGDLGEQF